MIARLRKTTSRLGRVRGASFLSAASSNHVISARFFRLHIDFFLAARILLNRVPRSKNWDLMKICDFSAEYPELGFCGRDLNS